ncbi:hypothetical protein CYLTODRAFT_489952 [Cylindrobasidium torrendii FP15055 ss-10]|uniref:MYND-type domain-containing protein n=1 Tax=Cylindrobasidium torrendii FP15055 ss-10 TaxID=1314674 RepID=A0A0D7BDJ0_9AGAR|nr:hypothetical protein CYLTODRAFT_489952 [Cylindrobasidium torrendii FP15055 ss-10]
MPNIFVWPDSPPIVRKCLVYKADASAIDPLVVDPGPSVIPMLFNIEGTDSNFMASTISELAPDLRATYGPATKDHIQLRMTEYGRDPLRPHLQNYYTIYWTRDIAHPKNETLCRMLGVDPDVPSTRPMWRGDVVVAFAQEDQRIIHENMMMVHQRRANPAFFWKDVPAEASCVMTGFFREEYASPQWLKSYYDDLEWAQFNLESQICKMSPLNRSATTILPWDRLRDEKLKSSEHDLEVAELHMRWGMYPALFSQQAADQPIPLAEEESERAERFKRRACASCGEDRPMKVCPCKYAYYCSVSCQKQDWKSGHKALLAHRKDGKQWTVDHEVY